MSNPKTATMKYFGYGSNKDLDMMIHMVGRQDLKGEQGKLLGYELCIQKLEHIRDQIPKNSPVNLSPQAIIKQGFGSSFELYVARPKPDGIVYGTIWDLTLEEIGLVKNWEMVECGMQEEVNAMAINASGDIVAVETQAVIDPPAIIDRIVTGDDYPAYIAPKDAMLKTADQARSDYLISKSGESSS